MHEYDVAKLFIKVKANVNAKDKEGHTPMDYAFGSSMKILLREHWGKTSRELALDASKKAIK
jgi:hypothetical protein